MAAVIGVPVRHSLSPAIFDAAFEATGLDWTYLAFEVTPDGLPAAVGAVAALGIAGLSVTMPHKAAIVPLLDDVSATATLLEAVNCVTRQDGRLVGDNTDGAGFLSSLRSAGVSVDGARVVVLGAEAAWAIIHTLGGAGAAQVTVVNRTESRAAAAAALAGPNGRVGTMGDVSSADLVINATSIGMAPAGGLPLDGDLLHGGQTVVDAVYHPVHTELLGVATARGAQAVDGVGMLVGQAGIAFERWTGLVPPLDAMRAAADRRLAH